MIKKISADFEKLTLQYECTSKNAFGSISTEDVEQLSRIIVCMFKIQTHPRIFEKIEHSYAIQQVCGIIRHRGTLDVRHVKGYIFSLNKKYEKVDKIYNHNS